MISGLLDSLKVALSDDYDIPDSEYNKLSGIFTNNGLSDVANDLFALPQFINCVIKNKVVFPVSYKYFLNLWKRDCSEFDFVKVLIPLLSNKIIRMVKVTDREYENDKIVKSFDDERVNGKYLVLYGTDLLDKMVSEVEPIISVYRKEDYSVNESTLPKTNTPKGLKDLYGKLSKLLKEMDIDIEFESFVLDADSDVIRVNFIISKTSKYACNDSEVYKIFKKYLKEKNIIEIESYIEGKNELFVGLGLRNGYKPLEIADEIYLAVKELEVEHV